MYKTLQRAFILVLILCLAVPFIQPIGKASAAGPISFTILHTNDFHGQLVASGSNPGMARVAKVVNDIRASVGAESVLLVDAGDEMQGSLLSNLQEGIPTIATFNAMGYDVATFGNHEFDWGQEVLTARTTQAAYPYVAANIVVNDTGNCATAGWSSPSFSRPYEIKTLNTPNGSVKVGFIGVTSTETPNITIASATAGLCFKDPYESILHWYDTVQGEADVIVLLSHLGYLDGGYGYGIPVIGDQTLAAKLYAAGKPVSLIIGGHSHTQLAAATLVNGITVVQAHYNGRRVGRANITFDPVAKTAGVTWSFTPVSTTGDIDPTVNSIITAYANNPEYLAMVNEPVGYSAVDLPRLGGTVDNMMATFVDDAIYNYLNTDAVASNDIDIFFNNAGGIRADWCYVGSAWVNTGCAEGTHDPGLLTYGNMFEILPFGNQTVVGEMTGARILEVLNQGPLVSNGVIQPAGLKYKYFAYKDTNPGPQPYAWGAFDYCVINKTTKLCEPLDLKRTYKVGTNEFLAPAGGDSYGGFRYMTNVTYWGDMLNAVNAYMSANHGSPGTAYAGPNGNGTLDGRILRDGNGDNSYSAGEIIPLTILHHNDSHGRLLQSGSTPGYTNLVTLIKQERLHNPDRTLLLTAGDNVQGDSMMYYFKSAGLGVAADGQTLEADLRINPLIKAFNFVGYDAWTLGNHEFNFGKEVFSTLAQANFPILQANIADTGAYGLSDIPVEPYTVKTVGPEAIKVAILGIGNHRVPSYELPSNIPGLTFSNPVQKGIELAPGLQAANDVVIALTHIGFTDDPNSVEVDTNVDTVFADQVPGVNAVIGGHSHTVPGTGFGPYKFLPTMVPGPGNQPVLVTQMHRYNNNLGEVVMGLRLEGDGYKVVSTAGRYIAVTTSLYAEDTSVKELIQPYQNLITTYNNTVIGETVTPIDTNLAFTQETNGANLQADASVWKLRTESIEVDFHLSGAMTNRLIANTATPATPYQLKVSDMFAAMPYENSLVVMQMNGPQLKAVLERAYRNFYYYNYVPGYGGYSYYTTCMLDTNAGNKIVYRDTHPALPNGNNVQDLLIGGVPVDFNDATRYYKVSSVNYLAAGACNFSDNGQTLWPLSQIVADTQYYVRDAVIEYVQAQPAAINPQVEGRLVYPTAVQAPMISPVNLKIGTSVTASATFTDPVPDDSPYTCVVNYGDGSGDLPGIITNDTCTGPAHTFTANGTYIVTVKVTDKNGTIGWNSTTIRVPTFSIYMPHVNR